MKEKQKLIRHLLASKGFRELDLPVIVTSGEFLTPFFCNTENLFMDSGISTILDTHGASPAALISYAVEESRKKREVDELISLLTGKAEELLPRDTPGAISGGQRRDWLFSGPVAARLNLPHISIFKPERENPERHQRIFMDLPSGERIENPDLSGCRVLHIADLLTMGSSIYSPPSGRKNPTGWLPALRQRGAEMKDLLVVVSRSQGGEELLAREGLETHSCIQIDSGFIKKHGKNQDSILHFLQDPVSWTIQYLSEYGIEILLPYTEHDPKKLPRLKKFMSRYRDFLEDMGWLEILQQRGSHEAA